MATPAIGTAAAGGNRCRRCAVGAHGCADGRQYDPASAGSARLAAPLGGRLRRSGRASVATDGDVCAGGTWCSLSVVLTAVATWRASSRRQALSVPSFDEASSSGIWSRAQSVSAWARRLPVAAFWRRCRFAIHARLPAAKTAVVRRWGHHDGRCDRLNRVFRNGRSVRCDRRAALARVCHRRLAVVVDFACRPPWRLDELDVSLRLALSGFWPAASVNPWHRRLGSWRCRPSAALHGAASEL